MRDKRTPKDVRGETNIQGKTTGLSSEPARLSCDYCQRMSDFDSSQFILIRMADKVLISPRCDI